MGCSCCAWGTCWVVVDVGVGCYWSQNGCGFGGLIVDVGVIYCWSQNGCRSGGLILGCVVVVVVVYHTRIVFESTLLILPELKKLLRLRPLPMLLNQITCEFAATHLSKVTLVMSFALKRTAGSNALSTLQLIVFPSIEPI